MGGLALTQPIGVELGVQEPFSIQNPGAGANISFSCDGRGLRRLQSLVLLLTTSAAVANRYLALEFQGSDGKAYAVAGVAAVQAASIARRYVFAVGYSAQAAAAGTDAFTGLPPVLLSPGDQLVTTVANIDVGDAITVVRGVLERFPLDGVGLPPLEPEA